MFRSLIQRVSRHYQRLLRAESGATRAPLLDEAALHELELYARSLPSSLLEFRRHASHPLIGETPSLYRGRGLEFEENRAYQAGDESRLVNWRLYARTGELYTKVFAEERRPQVFVVLDRRPPMRFATRGQLKVELAARLGICHAHQAQQQALAVGGLVMNQEPQWFTPAIGEVSLQGLIQAMAAPCPPLAFEQAQPDLAEQLQQVLHRLPAGSFVLLLSDFADLDPDSATSLLHHLAELHTVRAIQVLDPVETQFPESGVFLIEDRASTQPLRIDGHDVVQQDLYTKIFADRQVDLAACFRESGIPFRTCMTRDDVETCLGNEDGNSPVH
jgi:uncharacterized protein (DUF58 family)